jgi:hypothetical protein
MVLYGRETWSLVLREEHRPIWEEGNENMALPILDHISLLYSPYVIKINSDNMYYVYEKDQRALPGNLQNRRYNLFPPPNVMSLTTSTFGIATDYGLGDRGFGVRVAVGSRIFSSPCPPDRVLGPPSLISNEYGGLFPWGKLGGA